MLHFWKKSGQIPRNRQETGARDRQTPSSSSVAYNGETSKSTPLFSCDDEGLFDIDEFESTKERSRLSKTLSEVLSDKSALGYFLQFMESRNASAYIMCWLDIDSFKQDVSSFRQENTQQQKEEKEDTSSSSYQKLPNNRSTISPVPKTVEHDSLSVSTDCGEDSSYTADTFSLCETTTSNSVGLVDSCGANGFCDSKDNLSSDTSPRFLLKSSIAEESSTTTSCDDTSGGGGDNKNNKKLLSIQQHLVDSALMIFKKYVAQESTSSIKCTDALRNEVVENVCDTENILTGNCFDNIQTYIYETMEKEYFDAFLGSDSYCKHQIDVLTSGNVALDDILYNETALFYFMEYLEQENARNLLDFWIAATNLRQQLENQKEFFDPVEAQNDAVVLYDKYFSLQAHCPLGFGDKIRFAVEQSICGEDGLVLDCFHLPLKMVEQVLERNFLKQFLASQLFYKYLSELINTVQSNGYLTGSVENRRESPSDCSSERSFSTNSTFLALDMTPNNGANKRTFYSSSSSRNRDMSIDTRHLCDPDSLWKRKHFHKQLSCGRVTALGKFETDLQPEPGRNQFKLKNVINKFVSLEEDDRKKEEMAWQVAEMIVKDITNVTMNQSSSASGNL